MQKIKTKSNIWRKKIDKTKTPKIFLFRVKTFSFGKSGSRLCGYVAGKYWSANDREAKSWHAITSQWEVPTLNSRVLSRKVEQSNTFLTSLFLCLHHHHCCNLFCVCSQEQCSYCSTLSHHATCAHNSLDMETLSDNGSISNKIKKYFCFYWKLDMFLAVQDSSIGDIVTEWVRSLLISATPSNP